MGVEAQEGIERVLIPSWRIKLRVRRLARRLERDLAGKDPVIVAVLEGCTRFLADLARGLRMPVTVDFVKVSSYREGARPGEPCLERGPSVPVADRELLLVDDILDTGRTSALLVRMLKEAGAREVRTCFLLAKRKRRQAQVRADYVGFEIDDRFVVGYGLDHAGRFRDLPYIAALGRE